jgi:bifunctional non-homologous end joining protein LigD
MPLDQYQRKRDFSKTPEPAGAVGGGSGRFVVQRHRATRLHYDFRLEIDGLLVSWAVPRGPTLDPTARRMAVHVEDHPIEYFDFEGVIPRGQYGAGDVIVWDWGTWTPEAETPDPAAAVAAGELKFELHGEKLRGRYTIVRTSRRPGSEPTRPFEEDGQEQWLLIKKRDPASVPGWDAEDHPESVKTGRTNDEVKENRDALWMSAQPASEAEIDLSAAKETRLPASIPPMLATLADNAFSDDDWLYEIKWDGFRVEAIVDDGKVRTLTRNLNDAEAYFPGLLSPATWINARQAVVDGEVVALDEAGRPDFSRLQERLGAKGIGGLVYIAFDLLYLDGRSLFDVPLEDRKRLLRSVLREHPRVRYAGHVTGEGREFYRAARENRLEGIVAKHRRSRYEPGRRSTSWLKIKIRPEQEVVVGGWTPGEGNARDLGALVVGVMEDGRLRFSGKVGSGFRGETRRMLRARLDELATPDSPFDPAPPKDYRGRWGGELKGVVWVRPEIVIRAEIGGWSRDGIIRQAAFKGIDAGRDPATVQREVAVDSTTASAEAEVTIEAEQGKEATRVPRASGTRTATATKPRKPKAARATSGPSASGLPAEATEAELRVLAELGQEGTWTVGGQQLKLTNLDKVLFPPADGRDEPPITKRELIDYFARISPTVLPHLAERPLNLNRFPNGVAGPGFWQKDLPETAPTWLRRWREVGVDDREANDHLIADQVGALAWLGNQASFEFHAWTGKLPEPHRPTFALVDIDPGEKTSWDETLAIARLFRTAFEHLGVRAYPKLTGKRGIQAWLPIVPRYDFDETSAWVEKVSRAVGSMVPDLVSWEWAKSARKGRARLDYTQNTYIKTLVAPYAVRPAAGAPVSAPISWDELDDPDLRPNRWTIRDLPARVAEVGDLFAGAQTDAQELPPV